MDPVLADINLMLSRFGFATGGPSHIEFCRDRRVLISGYDALAVGWMLNHQVDDGTGHAGEQGFAIDMVDDFVASAPVLLPASVVKDVEWYRAVALKRGEMLLDVLMEAAGVSEGGGKSLAPTAPVQQGNVFAGIVEGLGEGDMTSVDAIAALVSTYTKVVLVALGEYDEGELTAAELVERVSPSTVPAGIGRG